MNFRVGQKVVCVGCDPELHTVMPPANAVIPVRQSIYTIRQINVWSYATLVLLHEINNSHLREWNGQIEPGFNIKGFRPLVERKTDISILTALLVPGAKISEDA